MTLKFSPFKVVLSIILTVCLIYDLNSIHSETFIVCGLLLMPVLFYNFNKIGIVNKKLIFLSAVFLTLIILYRLVGISSCELYDIAVYIDWTIVLFTSIFLSKARMSQREKYICIFVSYSLIMLQLFTVVIERFASFQIAYGDVSRLRITEFGSMAMFFSAGCLIWFLNDRKLINQVLAIAGVVAALYVNLFIMQRLINAFCNISMLGLILLYNSNRKRWIMFAFWGVVFSVFILYISSGYTFIIDFLLDNIESIRIRERLLDVKDLLITGTFFETGRFSGRSDLMKVTYASWTTSPITFLFGVGDHRGYNTIIGNHCEYLDCFGRYGIFGGTLVLAITWYLIKFMLSFDKTKSKMYYQFLCVAIFFVIRNFLGIVSVYQVGIPMLLFTQLIIYYCTEVKEGL